MACLFCRRFVRSAQPQCTHVWVLPCDHRKALTLAQQISTDFHKHVYSRHYMYICIIFSRRYELMGCDWIPAMKEIVYRPLAFLNSPLSSRFWLPAIWHLHWLLKKHPKFNMTHPDLFILIDNPASLTLQKSPYSVPTFLILASGTNVHLTAHTKYFRIIFDSSTSSTYSSYCFNTRCGQSKMSVGNVIHGPMLVHLDLRSFGAWALCE